MHASAWLPHVGHGVGVSFRAKVQASWKNSDFIDEASQRNGPGT